MAAKALTFFLITSYIAFFSTTAQSQTAEQWLDEAMNACQQGQTDKAFTLFEQIESWNPPEGIRALIQFQKEQGCQAQTALVRVEKTASIELGQATNANLGSSSDSIRLTALPFSPEFLLADDSLPKPSNFSMVSFGMKQAPYEITFLHKAYYQQPDYSQSHAAVNFSDRHWLHQFSIHALADTFNYAQWKTYYQTSPYWGLKTQVLKENQDNSVKAELEPYLKWTFNYGQLKLGYQLPILQREQKGDLTYGPTLLVQFDYPLSKPLPAGKLKALFYAHHLTANNVFSQGLIDTKRQNRFGYLKLSYETNLNAQWRVAINYEHSDSHDQIELFQFTNRQLSLSFDYRWR